MTSTPVRVRVTADEAKVIDRLSTDLRQRFPNARGYSPRNLKYMRAFAAAWPEWEVVQRTVARLPWRHQVALLDKLDSPELRQWYAAVALDQGWSGDVLALQIDRRLHERSGKAVSNFHQTLPEPDSDLAQQATRDPYLFDFLSTTETRLERDVEQGLIEHVRDFLLELGQGFAFVGSQVRLELGGREFYCDLLFFHTGLRCYVVIELKAREFDPSHLGQLGLYLAAVDDFLAHPGDKPTIGPLLCIVTFCKRDAGEHHRAEEDPPDKQPAAIKLVIEQMEQLAPRCTISPRRHPAHTARDVLVHQARWR